MSRYIDAEKLTDSIFDTGMSLMSSGTSMTILNS